MSRSYKKLPVKKDFVYTTDELVRLIGVTKNTVSNWGKEGLRPSDGNIPYIFNGSEVIRFHKERRARSSVKLRKGQFKCFSCKGRVFPDPNSLSIKDHGLGMKSIWGPVRTVEARSQSA